MATSEQEYSHKSEEPKPRDPYMTITLSKECVESVLKYIKQSTIPFLLGVAVGGGGVAGIADRLLAQPEAPTTPEVEEVSPQHKHG